MAGYLLDNGGHIVVFHYEDEMNFEITQERCVIDIKNMDCMDAMRNMPDKAFDLAIVDPPYGGGQNQSWIGKERSRFGGNFDKYKIERTGGTWSTKYGREIKHWDVAPPQEYFDELSRISKYQIIWGGNYFQLPPSNNFIIWRKLTISESFSMAMAEYAWTNIPGNAKVFECVPQDIQRFHPTQKPVALYKWLLKNYAEKGYKILDTHTGSAGIAIACWDACLDLTGFELDAEYYKLAIARIDKYKKQGQFL